MPSTQYLRVAVPLPLPQALTYAIPETLADRVGLGARVVVPVRRRQMVGIVVGNDAAPPGIEVKEILAAPDAEPAIPAPLLATAEWMAGYYGSPLGIALKAMLPAPLWGESEVFLERLGTDQVGGGTAGELCRWLDQRQGRASMLTAARALKKPLWEVADRLVRVGALRLVTEPAATDGSRALRRALALAGAPLGESEQTDRFRGKARQRALYQALLRADQPLSLETIQGTLGMSASVVRGLVDAGLARPIHLERHRDPFADLATSAPPGELTAAQVAAVAAIGEVPAGGGALVFGVTGSGKTLVYLEAIRRAVDSGSGAIILVPEIGLTPQTVARVRGMFGDRVAVLHSALSDGERADAWRALRDGRRLVAVGPRSAVFAPVRSLGFLVVDEEHEASYKNGEAPRYHARDVARVRCRLEQARLILGSATPSLESATLVPDRLSMIRLPERIGARPLPPVELIDLKTAPRVTDIGSMLWSEALDTALQETRKAGNQALLLLNRRGYAAFLQCGSCGQVSSCPHCSVSLTVHRNPGRLKCHYCGYQIEPTATCSRCGGPAVRGQGIGTQQVAHVVAERLPGVTIARMDLDTTATKWSHHRILDRFARGEVQVLVGTQMVAKGIDFPNVTLVGVVDADVGLNLPDFRAAERTFQLITQVAGRAGRGPKGGRVLVQTRSPEHPALRFAMRHDTEGFWAAERAQRAEPAYPPLTSLVNVVTSGPDEKEVAASCGASTAWLADLVAAQRLPVEVLGPAPCPIAKIKDRHRWHAILKGPESALGRIVRYAATRLEGTDRVRIAIDRDPVAML